MDRHERRLAQENDPLLHTAAQWAIELGSAELSLERMTEWQLWLNQDPRHADAFARIERLLGSVEHIDTVSWPTPAQLAADDYDGSIPVSAHRSRQAPAAAHPTTRRRTSRRGNHWARHGMWAAAASVVLAVTGVLLSGYPRSIHLPGLLAFDRVTTQAGGTQKIVLTDGSAIDLSGETALRATLTSGARNITLDSGEAFFRVAKDAGRPFIVHAGDTSVRAVGTAFNVRRAGDRVVVAVAEGTVLVSTPGKTAELQTAQITAGEQTIVKSSASPLEKIAIDTRSVAGWRNGRLQYLDEPLASVAADVGRYTARTIEVTDPRLRDLRITSTVLENNIDGWLQSLEAAFPVAVERHTDGSVTIAARAAP